MQYDDNKLLIYCINVTLIHFYYLLLAWLLTFFYFIFYFIFSFYFASFGFFKCQHLKHHHMLTWILFYNFASFLQTNTHTHIQNSPLFWTLQTFKGNCWPKKKRNNPKCLSFTFVRIPAIWKYQRISIKEAKPTTRIMENFRDVSY